MDNLENLLKDVLAMIARIDSVAELIEDRRTEETRYSAWAALEHLQNAIRLELKQSAQKGDI